MVSIFHRAPETYLEPPGQVDAIRGDAQNPLQQIAQLIDRGSLLDVGCGAGLLGRVLATNTEVIVDGVDPAIAPDNPGVRGYRRFEQGGIELLLGKGSLSQYDWIVFADVLEHFAYPDEMLRQVIAEAKPGARFVISTPNVAHVSVRLDVLAGKFEYTRSGILESTHLRFFTLSTLRTFLAAVGLEIERGICLNQSSFADRARPLSPLRTALALGLMRDSSCPLAYQFLVVARKAASGGAGREAPVFEQVGPSTLHGVRRAAWMALLGSAIGRR